MLRFLKGNWLSITLLVCVIVGGLCGLLFGDAAHAAGPVGEIFLNLIFVLVVPMVFFSIASSLCKLKQSGMVGRVFGYIVAVFLAMNIVAAIVAYFSCLVFNPLAGVDSSALDVCAAAGPAPEARDVAKAVVSSLTVPDFYQLLSKSNLLPLIIFAVLFGIATAASGEKGAKVAAFLESGSEVTMKMMDMLMYAAPIGLGCYFADTIASLGGQILTGYLRTLVLYCVLTAVMFFVVHSAYVLIFRGAEGLKLFWANILPPSLTSFASASSAAALPANISAAKKAGVSPEIADAVVPLGVNIHKDGSVLASVIKVVFLLTLFGHPYTGVGGALTVIGVAIISSIVMGAIPSGGMTGELLTCTLLGLDPTAAGIIIIIGTIVDMPASLMNTSCNNVAAVIVDALASRRGKCAASRR